jgi:hypothetical protein
MHCPSRISSIVPAVSGSIVPAVSGTSLTLPCHQPWTLQWIPLTQTMRSCSPSPLQVCDICHGRVNREIELSMHCAVDGLIHPQSPRIVDGFAATTESITALMTTAMTGQRSVLLPTSLVTEVGTAYDTTSITGLPALTGLPSLLLPTSRVTEEGNTDDTTAITVLPSLLLHTSLITEEGTADDTVQVLDAPITSLMPENIILQNARSIDDIAKHFQELFPPNSVSMGII